MFLTGNDLVGCFVGCGNLGRSSVQGIAPKKLEKCPKSYDLGHNLLVREGGLEPPRPE